MAPRYGRIAPPVLCYNRVASPDPAPRTVAAATPTVLRVGPYRFFFYSNEGQEPPHIHVRAGDALAKFWLDHVSLASSRGFNGRQLKKIERLVQTHRETLLEAWYAYFQD